MVRGQLYLLSDVRTLFNFLKTPILVADHSSQGTPDSLAMKKVLAFGTFDHLHKGHIFYLEQARALGDELHVLVACDQAVEWAKGRPPRQPEQERLAHIKELSIVDAAYLGEPVATIADYLRPIQQIKPDIICLGYDQMLGEEEWLKREVARLSPIPTVVRVQSHKPKEYKSSLLRSAPHT